MQTQPAPLSEILHLSIILACYIAHWWMMFFARAKIKNTNEDKVLDPIYNRITAPIAFLLAFIWVSLLTLRALCPPPSLPTPPSPLAHLINAYTWSTTTTLLITSAAIFTIGFSIRYWAIRTLGRLFTFEVAIRKNHALITAGPYNSMRHPSYMGYGLMIIAMGLQYGSAFLFASVVVPTLIFFMFRIPIEEKVLEKNFGQAWTKRKNETWLTFP